MGRGVWAARRAPFADRRRRSMTNPLLAPFAHFWLARAEVRVADVKYSREPCAVSRLLRLWLCRAGYRLLAPRAEQRDSAHAGARPHRRRSGRVRAIRSCRARPRRLYAPVPRNLRGFIVWHCLLCAWVAEADGAIVGHVALHAAAPPGIMALARRMMARTRDQFGVVARLLVSPVARRRGLGRRLLLTAVENACERGLKPMLEVTADLEPAIRLYENCGWVCAGKVQVYWRSTDEFVCSGAFALAVLADAVPVEHATIAKIRQQVLPIFIFIGFSNRCFENGQSRSLAQTRLAGVPRIGTGSDDSCR